MIAARPIQVRRRNLRVAAVVATLILVALVVWIDISTSLWQELVILSGLAAGIVTFLFTAVFLDGILARAEHERWIPVTQLALTDLLHALAHEDSLLTRGEVEPRELRAGDPTDRAELDELLEAVLRERRDLTSTLARWSAFLAASADVTELMDHVAALAVHLDSVRDAALEIERSGGPDDALRREVDDYNSRIQKAITEIQALLAVGVAADR